MAPCLVCYFIVILFYIERKWLMRNLARILPLKPKLSGKFQRVNAIGGISKCWKIVEFPKISIKMKNCKTFCEAETTSRLNEIIKPPSNPPPYDKILLCLWNKTFLTKIYRNIRTFAFKLLHECSFGCQEKVECKCFFWHQTEICLLENW